MAPYSSCQWQHMQLKTQHEVTQWNFIPQPEVWKVRYSKDSHWIRVININTKYNQSVQDQALHHTFFISWRPKMALLTISQNWAACLGDFHPDSRQNFASCFCSPNCQQDQAHYNSLRNTWQELNSKQVNSIIHNLGGPVSIPDNWMGPGLRL